MARYALDVEAVSPATGGVITSAGFVLAATFAVLGTLPSTTLTEIGYTVAFGTPRTGWRGTTGRSG